MNLAAVMVEHNLSIEPVYHTDIHSKVRPFPYSRDWVCVQKEYHRRGNYEVHGAVGETPEAAVSAWLGLYGPNPTHKIVVGAVVRHVFYPKPDGPARVLKVGRWRAVAAFEDRVPALFPLCHLAVVNEELSRVGDEEDAAFVASADCDATGSND